jgi:hypothetical protein
MNILTITKADKGKTLVILNTRGIQTQNTNFIHGNQFTTIKNNLTKYYKNYKTTLKQCNNHTQRKHMEIHECEPHTPKRTCHNKATQTKHTH